jgi:hypothetical protein
VILAAVALASVIQTQEPVTTTRWSKIEHVAGFDGWRAQFQHMADTGAHALNHMCVVVATYSQPGAHQTTVWAYLYWRETDELYTLDQSKGPMDDLSIFKGPLNLKTDVVRQDRDIRGSTYLVTRAWVDDILHHCRTDGEQLVIRRAHV